VGKAASLFYSSNAEKQTLHRRITPSDDQIASQQEYWNDLADYLKPDLKERSGCAVTSWIQGSYKFATQIRPAQKGQEYDIDLGVYFAWAGEPEDGEHIAADLKAMVQDSLNAYAASPDTDALRVTSPKEFCSRIVFNAEFHIDVPAYHEDGEARTLASKSHGFVESDPVSIWEWWIATFAIAERPRARRMVRYFKMWAALKFDPKTETPPTSIMLTILVAYGYNRIDLDDVDGDDGLLSALVAAVADYLDGQNSKEVPNPVNSEENLNRLGNDYELFRERLDDFLEVCKRAMDAEDAASAAELWSESFEHFFPLPDEQEIAKSDTETARALVAAFVPEVEITVSLPGSGRSYRLRNIANNISRDSTLDFHIVNSNELPAGAHVKWVVRNEGNAAEAANDLGHFAGFGIAHKNEHAEYKGRHFMDLTVSAYGRIIGLRRIPVSIINNSTAEQKRKRLFRKN